MGKPKKLTKTQIKLNVQNKNNYSKKKERIIYSDWPVR